MVLREVDVLRRIDTSIIDDQDQWPEFVLKDVKITSSKGGEMVSLLAAQANSLVRVEGYLEQVASEHSHLVLYPNYRRQPLCIDDVAIYSFSQWDDGSLGFWAAGRAGWYEIRSPDKSYESIYHDMEEATGMFYYVADKYRNSLDAGVKGTARARQMHVRSLMTGYLENDTNRREDDEDVIEGFYNHRRFLLKSMLEGQEGLDWESSLFFRHLKKKFPKDFWAMQNIVRIGLNLNSQSTSKSSADGDEDLGSEEEATVVDYTGDVSRRAKRRSVLRPKSEKSAKTYTQMKQSKTRSICQAENDMSPEKEGKEDSYETAQIGDIAASKSLPESRDTIKGLSSPNGAQSGFALPSYYEPTGPGDTWKCSYDGCNHRVWNARSAESVDLIKAHFSKTHVDSMEELINSESRPWISVGHLLERLKDVAASGPHGQNAETQRLPNRVIRRY